MAFWELVFSFHYVEPEVELRTSSLAANAFISTKLSCWSLLLSDPLLPVEGQPVPSPALARQPVSLF